MLARKALVTSQGTQLSVSVEMFVRKALIISQSIHVDRLSGNVCSGSLSYLTGHPTYHFGGNGSSEGVSHLTGYPTDRFDGRAIFVRKKLVV